MTQKTPSHLSKSAKVLWQAIVGDYSIDDAAGLKILLVALEAADRCEAARQQIEKEGMILDGKKHPLLQTERDSRAAFLHGIKSLNLDLEPLRDRPGRP